MEQVFRDVAQIAIYERMQTSIQPKDRYIFKRLLNFHGESLALTRRISTEIFAIHFVFPCLFDS
jgi:hypothetical protein